MIRSLISDLFGFESAKGEWTEVLSVIKERFRDIASLACTPIVVLNARDPIANRQTALDAGAVAFFQKPADNEQLLGAIVKALG